jgi:hypothetical protein
MEINKGKKGTRDASSIMGKKPCGAIGPKDGQGGVIESIKMKIMTPKGKVSDYIKGAMDKMKSASSRVNSSLKSSPIKKEKDSMIDSYPTRRQLKKILEKKDRPVSSGIGVGP